jgi:hypothetical protein
LPLCAVIKVHLNLHFLQLSDNESLFRILFFEVDVDEVLWLAFREVVGYFGRGHRLIKKCNVEFKINVWKQLLLLNLCEKYKNK